LGKFSGEFFGRIFGRILGEFLGESGHPARAIHVRRRPNHPKKNFSAFLLLKIYAETF
jgi:hypothetical protein